MLLPGLVGGLAGFEAAVQRGKCGGVIAAPVLYRREAAQTDDHARALEAFEDRDSFADEPLAFLGRAVARPCPAEVDQAVGNPRMAVRKCLARDRQRALVSLH